MEQNTTSVVIEQQGENKKRGALAVILAVAFVAMLGIGTTFAYLTYQGNQTPNRFTTDVGISVDLLEPSWVAGDGVASDGKTGIPVEADNTQPTDAEAAKKDPYVVNTSRIGNEDQSGVSVYAGIKLTFQKWVATGVTNGADGSHTETGQYVNMTQDETAKLLNCYQFAATSKVGEGDGYAGDNAGMFIDDGWIQVKADGSGTTA